MFCIGCSSQPSAKYLSLTAHYFPSFVPIAQQAVQAVMTCRLSLKMCLCFLLSLCPACIAKNITKNSRQIFPEKALLGHSPNSYIHVSVSDLYIPLIGLPIVLQEKKVD
jgi:hypothetical protein